MGEMPHQKTQREAVEGLILLLAKEIPNDPNAISVEHFAPWDLCPAVYGSYDSEFDACAIEVLTEIQGGIKVRSDLGAEMFREMLCVANLCEYGTSPRVCFPTLGFKDHLPELLSKWISYANVMWGVDGWQNGE